MSRRFFAGAAIVVWSVSPWAVRDAHAQDAAAPVGQPLPLLFAASDTTTTAPPAAAAPDAAQVLPQIVRPSFEGGHDKTMLPFYASTVLLEALDVHSTLTVLKLGGGEGNPLLKGLVSNRPAFIAVKAGMAAGTIFAVHHMAKHSKVAAIITAVGINAAYSFVVWHNYKVAAGLR